MCAVAFQFRKLEQRILYRGLLSFRPYLMEIAHHSFCGSSGGGTSFTTFLSKNVRVNQVNHRLNRLNHKPALAATRTRSARQQ